jgi:hypothetical protein
MTPIYEEERFRALLRRRGMDEEPSVRAVATCQTFLEGEGIVPGGASVQDLREYLDARLLTGDDVIGELPALAAYSAMIGDMESFSYLRALLNTDGVLEAMAQRLQELEGDSVRSQALVGVTIPPAGAPLELYPVEIARFMRQLQRELPPERCVEVLSGNFHRVPPESFDAKKARFEAAMDLDSFLAGERDILLQELEGCLSSGQPWHDIVVSEELLGLVRADDTMGAGRRQGDRIIHTKLPYDAMALAREQDPVRRRFHVCHCPLVRTALRDGVAVPALFCQCSAGFARLPYAALFGEVPKVEVLETALGGAERCRFAISIPKRIR